MNRFIFAADKTPGRPAPAQVLRCKNFKTWVKRVRRLTLFLSAMPIIAAIFTAVAVLGLIAFLINRNEAVNNTRRGNQIKDDADRRRMEREITKHGEEVKRIMEKINRYKNVLVLLVFPLAGWGQSSTGMKIPELNYKDVIFINSRGFVMNYADSVVVINPERYRFYEGLLMDITNLNGHYEAIIANKDSIIELTQNQLQESDDLLNQCANELNAARQKKNEGWLGGTGRVLLGLIIGTAAVIGAIKLL